jgi:hypothetical protein
LNKTIKTHRQEQLADKTAIHLLPFKLQSIPRFDPQDSDHSLLAKTSRECRLAVRDKIERSRGTAKNIHVAIAHIIKKRLHIVDEKVALLGKST